MVCETGFHGLLGQWFSGEEVRDCTWGIKILWLGRIGKFLTFLAGFAILIDIFGERRIKRLGAILRLSRMRLRQANALVRDLTIRIMCIVISSPMIIISRSWYRIAYSNLQHFFGWVYREGLLASLIVSSGIAIVIVLMVTAIGIDPITAKLDDLPKAVQIVIILLYLPVVVIYGLQYAGYGLSGAEAVFVNPTIWALRNRYFIVTARTLSLFLLGAGILFDIFAS